MTKSESIKELATALCKFQASVEAITKDSTNPFFKSKYASLSAIIEDTRDLLAKNGLSYAQFPTGVKERYRGFDDDDAVEGGAAGLTTILMHSSGEYIMATFPITPVDNKPQSLGSAITYARRYALQSILGLQVEDDDGNAASQPKAAPQAKPVEVPKPSFIAQVQAHTKERKARVKELVDAKALNPVEGKEGYENYVLANTGLKLTVDNLGAIISKLEALSN